MHILYKYLHTSINMSVSESETERKTGRERERETERNTGACMCLSADWDLRTTRGVLCFCLCVCMCLRDSQFLSLSPSVFMWPRVLVSCVWRWLTLAAPIGLTDLRRLGGDPDRPSWNREGVAGRHHPDRCHHKSCRCCWCCPPESARWAPDAASQGIGSRWGPPPHRQ